MVIVRDIDRLTHNLTDWNAFKKAYVQHDVQLSACTGGDLNLSTAKAPTRRDGNAQRAGRCRYWLATRRRTDRYPAARKMTSLEDRGCEIGVLADQAMPLIPGS